MFKSFFSCLDSYSRSPQDETMIKPLETPKWPSGFNSPICFFFNVSRPDSSELSETIPQKISNFPTNKKKTKKNLEFSLPNKKKETKKVEFPYKIPGNIPKKISKCSQDRLRDHLPGAWVASCSAPGGSDRLGRKERKEWCFQPEISTRWWPLSL